MRKEGDEVRVARIGLLGGVACDLALALDRQTVDEDIVHASALTCFGREAPVEAGGFESHDELRQAMSAAAQLGLWKEAIDLVSTAPQAPTAEDMAVVRERSGLLFTGQIDAQHQRITGDSSTTSSSLLLLATKTARDERAL